MTILHVYNLYDSTIETYTAQFLSSHDKLMKRECENLYEQAKQIHAKNPLAPQGALYRYADSYLMMHTADFDDQNGKYIPLNVPVPICNFNIFANKENVTDEKDINKLFSPNSNEQAYADIIANA